MGRRNLKTAWIEAVAGADVGNACKALLFYFATRMSAAGFVDPPRREDLAGLFHVHHQRIAERIVEARQAGLLQQQDGTGVRGVRARYVATLPRRNVPESGTQWIPQNGMDNVPESGTDAAGFLTGERYVEIGTHSDALDTAQRYSQRARVTGASRTRTDHERDVGVPPEHVVTQDSSDEEAPAHSSLAADSPEHVPARDDDHLRSAANMSPDHVANVGEMAEPASADHDIHEMDPTSGAAALQQTRQCAVVGCDRPARRSCLTCAEHMTDEVTFREAS